MRPLAIFMFLFLAAGCASKPAPVAVATNSDYSEGAAASLAFTPPIALGQAPIELPRDVRQPAAFVGWDDLTATYFYTRTDDRQNISRDGWSYRRAISEKVGVSYR